MLRIALLAASTAALAGCIGLTPQTDALLQQWPAGLPARADLAHVPFHPQRDYQCGPAALAMALDASGVLVRTDDLVPQVYVPEREGSLQVEMLAAPRRYGRVSYRLAPRLPDVLREVAAGTPVIVLQDYGAWGVNLWHYAVVAGYDAHAGEMLLRSGENERLAMPFPVFEHLWKSGGYWSMVVVPPRQVPLTAEEPRYLEAVAAIERLPGASAAVEAYAAAISRWPGSVTARIGLANAYYAGGELERAGDTLREALRRAPDSAPDSVVVLNNLAQILSELGRHEEALALIDRALQAGGAFGATVQDTRAQIVRRMKRGAGQPAH